MTDAKRERQRAAREAKRAAEAAAARKALARRRMRTLAIGAVVVAAIIAFSLRGGDDESTEVTAGSTTTPTATGSAAGKPCVPVSDTPPAGAPAVPVKVGAPPTELVKEDLVAGTGAPVPAGATVTVNYIGVSCSTGKIFDASYGKQPATFSLSGVITGWTDGIPGMNIGGQRLLGIPPEQAYGPAGRPGTIAPDETLWFVVEVLGVS